MVFLNRFLNFFTRLLMAPPTRWDAWVLAALAVVATFNPFYLNRPINLFEMGLYLPGMNATLHGLFPFRDFFHLRGPLDVWVPAKLLQVFGMHMSVLSFYFFAGNVLCLVLIAFIAKELMQSRYMLYVMMPVIITRTWPRIIYMIWGGARYAMALLAILWLIKAFKNRRLPLFFWGGVATVIASLISIEMGVYVFLGVLIALAFAWAAKVYEPAWLSKAAGAYIGGCALIGGIFVVYYALNHALVPYIEATLAVTLDMQKIIDPHAVSIYPRNFSEAFASMINPVSINFKQMTPSYTYIVLLGYLAWRFKRKVINALDVCLMMLGIYGFVMYNTAFRCLWTAQFEMALQPEKILYFYLVEEFLRWVWGKRTSFKTWQTYAVQGLIAVLFISSVGYAIDRLDHRFFTFQYVRDALRGKNTERLKYFSDEPYVPLTIERARGIKVPVDQARELEATMSFIAAHTKPTDAVAFYPEIAVYSYFTDRPFMGRFSTGTFAWFREDWYQEYIRDLKTSTNVKYLFVSKELPKDWDKVYFSFKRNRERFEETNAVIQQYYKRVGETPDLYIYERNI